MHFTPTYSSWINQVERFFALITDKTIRTPEFQADVERCIAGNMTQEQLRAVSLARTHAAGKAAALAAAAPIELRHAARVR